MSKGVDMFTQTENAKVAAREDVMSDGLDIWNSLDAHEEDNARIEADARRGTVAPCGTVVQTNSDARMSRGSGLGWRVASYARLSREDKVRGESDSIAGQRTLIADWAARQGDVQVVASYVDDGYSGATFDRPGFMRMIDDAKRGLFDTIVVKDLSRFGRSYLDCGSWIERELPRLGVRLYSVTDDFDSMRQWDYNTALLLPMKNLINEMQVITTSEKVRASLAAKRERGECVANFAPYGYMKDPLDRHRLVVDPEAARVVQHIFALRLMGRSATAIAEELNDEGVPSPLVRKMQLGSEYRTGFGALNAKNTNAARNFATVSNAGSISGLGCAGTSADEANIMAANSSDEVSDMRETGNVSGATYSDVSSARALPRWHAKTVVRILRNETYVGTLVQGKTRRPNWRAGAVTHVPESEWVKSCGTHEPLVNHDAFARVQETVRSRASESHIVSDVLLSVHLFCDSCQAPMRRISVTSKGKRYHYFVCSTHRKNPRLCSTHSVPMDKLAQEVRAYLERNMSASDPAVMCIHVSENGSICD